MQHWHKNMPMGLKKCSYCDEIHAFKLISEENISERLHGRRDSISAVFRLLVLYKVVLENLYETFYWKKISFFVLAFDKQLRALSLL